MSNVVPIKKPKVKPKIGDIYYWGDGYDGNIEIAFFQILNGKEYVRFYTLWFKRSLCEEPLPMEWFLEALKPFQGGE